MRETLVRQTVETEIKPRLKTFGVSVCARCDELAEGSRHRFVVQLRQQLARELRKFFFALAA